MPFTHTPPPSSASQGHLFFPAPTPSRSVSVFPLFYLLFCFCLHHSLIFSSYLFLHPNPSIQFHLLFFLNFSLGLLIFYFGLVYLLHLLFFFPFYSLIFHLSFFTTPSSALSGPGASCGLPYSISHFTLPLLLFFSFLPSLLPFSFLSFPLTLRLIFIHPVKAAANNRCNPPLSPQKRKENVLLLRSVQFKHVSLRKLI